MIKYHNFGIMEITPYCPIRKTFLVILRLIAKQFVHVSSLLITCYVHHLYLSKHLGQLNSHSFTTNLIKTETGMINCKSNVNDSKLRGYKDQKSLKVFFVVVLVVIIIADNTFSVS